MSNSNDFVSLHTHSDHSLLDGFGSISEYGQRVVQLQQRGLGLTDHGNESGIPELLSTCRQLDITPIPGCEFYVAPQNSEGAQVKKPVYYGDDVNNNDVASKGAYLHLTVWAYNNVGLQNIFELSTMSYRPENFYKKPRIDLDMLSRHSDGLIVSTGCPSSEISTRFRLGQEDKAYEYAGWLKDIFTPERLFVEIMDHSMSIDLERDLLPQQLRLAQKMGLELLATNDSHYAHASDASHHEEMLAMQSASKMSDATYDNGGRRFSFQGDQYYLKSSEEMYSLFPEREFPNAIKNTVRVAEMAQDISLDYDPSLRPHPIVPEGETEISYFHKLINIGFKERYGTAPREIQQEAVRRIKHEDQVIVSSDFVGYFLVVRDYLKWNLEKFATRDSKGNIVALPNGAGRGSVGGSVIAYVLGIHETDPIRWKLPFERFLSAGRGNVYTIQYDDGSEEEVVASEVKNVVSGGTGDQRYVHQLQPGDEIVCEENKEQ